MIKLIFIVIVLVNFLCIYATAINEVKPVKGIKDISNVNGEMARTRRRPFGGGYFGHGVGHYFGLHALAILYWLKVKAVIITFIIGTAIVWAARYFWAQKTCPKEIIHEGSIIPFDHGPAWSPASYSHHDHTPYSSISYSEHDPYSSYSSYVDTPPTASGAESEHYLDHNPNDKKWKRKARSVRQLDDENTEEQISDLMFYFLGVGSNACRKRFLCEWEFQSMKNPITRMAFRIIGRGVFKKYARDPKDKNGAKSFNECARVHSECTVIEEDEVDSNDTSTVVVNNIQNEIDSEQLTNRKIMSRRDPIAASILRTR